MPKASSADKKLLASALESAQKATRALLRAQSKAQPLSADLENLSDEQDDILETLTSRFARLSDILIQQVFRAIDIIELVDEGSILDRLNRMEKRQIISNAETWIEIRKIRNRISHEYAEGDLQGLRKQALDFVDELATTLKTCEGYVKRNLRIK